MRAVLADTGPLYAQVDRDDAHHERAHREAKSLLAAGFVPAIAFPTLLECQALLMRSFGPSVSHRWLGEITDGRAALVNAVPDDYLASGHRLGRFPDQAISLHDALLAVLSERLQLSVWTYDHHFDVMGVEVWRE